MIDQVKMKGSQQANQDEKDKYHSKRYPIDYHFNQVLVPFHLLPDKNDRDDKGQEIEAD